MATLLRAADNLHLVDVEVEGARTDVLVRGGRVTVGMGQAAGAERIDGAGGALLPALHDHHLHLLALAAAACSVPCGPPAVQSRDQLRVALTGARSGPVRGIGYHESVAGPLDRDLLDALLPARPARVQHRTGGFWALNTPALQALGLQDVPDGRLWRGNSRLPHEATEPDLPALGEQLALLGVLGVCDATPDLAPEALRQLVEANLPQQVLALGAPAGWEHPQVRSGPMKVLLGDEDLSWDRLLDKVIGAREADRAVAVHTVTRESLLLALAVLDEVGRVPGDRIEHAAVVPPDVLDRLTGLAVVTQPALAASRGDTYVADVDPRDQPDLWRYASLLEAGIRVAPSSDGPYGPHDPWEVLRSARDRRTPEGRVLGPDERVAVRTALDGMLSPLDAPGAAPRRVTDGPDLMLLHVPIEQALREPTGDNVRLVLAAR